LRFGGFAEMTLARAWSAGDGPLRACSVMRGGVGLFAGARRRREAEELDLSNPALFPFGWGRLERAGGSRTRWTRATRADMLVPLSEAREFVLEIEARPVGTAPTTLALEVNDMPLAPVALEGRSAVYRWEVPAGVWRAGMNRVRVSTSRLVRPSDVVGNADDRLLGLGVTRVRLLQADASAETGGAGPM
jgi:hypothetical protein